MEQSKKEQLVQTWKKFASHPDKFENICPYCRQRFNLFEAHLLEKEKKLICFRCHDPPSDEEWDFLTEFRKEEKHVSIPLKKSLSREVEVKLEEAARENIENFTSSISSQPARCQYICRYGAMVGTQCRNPALKNGNYCSLCLLKFN